VVLPWRAGGLPAGVPVRALRPTFARGLVAAHPGRARLPPERPRARRTCCRPATYLTVPSPTRTPATQGSRLWTGRGPR
jgi:hypothetical protein